MCRRGWTRCRNKIIEISKEKRKGNVCIGGARPPFPAEVLYGYCSRVDVYKRQSFDCELDFGREFEVQDGQEESLDDEPFMKGYNLDVDQLVCNELLLSLPMKVLCREDCKGICNRCGTNLNLRTCTCDTRSLDPRMSVIQEIFNEFKEV